MPALVNYQGRLAYPDGSPLPASGAIFSGNIGDATKGTPPNDGPGWLMQSQFDVGEPRLEPVDSALYTARGSVIYSAP